MPAFQTTGRRALHKRDGSFCVRRRPTTGAEGGAVACPRYDYRICGQALSVSPEDKRVKKAVNEVLEKHGVKVK